MSDLQISSSGVGRPQPGLGPTANNQRETEETRQSNLRANDQLTLTERGLINDQFNELSGEIDAITTADDVIDLSAEAAERAEQEQETREAAEDREPIQASSVDESPVNEPGVTLDLLA